MDKKRREILSLALPSALLALTPVTVRAGSKEIDKSVTTQSTPPVTNLNTESISFSRFLREKKGTVDATQALIDAITSGSPVEIPHDYILRIESSGIPTIPGSRLFGQAGTTPRILIDHTDIRNPQFVLKGSNRFENLLFRYPNQRLRLAAGQEPIKYKPLFYGAGYFSEFINIDIGNAYYGFLLGTKEISSSHVVINNVIGSPIFRGLSLDCCLDIPRVSDVHFNYNYLIGDGFSYDQTLKQWMYDHATAFHIGRCDFSTFFRLFSYGYHRGIYLRSERSTGSADNCRFISCDMDMSRHPIWFQNWQNKVSITDSKLVGNAKGTDMGFSAGPASYNVIRNSENGLAVLDNLDVNGYTSHALVTQADTVVSNSRFGAYGFAGKASAGIFVNSDVPLSVDTTTIDGGAGKKTTGIYSYLSTHFLNIGNGVEIANQADKSFSWVNGPVSIDNGVNLGGKDGESDLSIISHIPKTFFSASAPVKGRYFMPGDSVVLTNPINIVKDLNNVSYIVTGFKRLTASNDNGDNHAIGIDWFETRSYF